jgi:hypothetical protein
MQEATSAETMAIGDQEFAAYMDGKREVCTPTISMPGTVRHNFYLSPGSSFKLRATMERLPTGVTSAPPEVTSDEGHFMVQVPAGKHRIEFKKSRYRQFTTEIEVGDGQTVPLNVSLMTTSS